MICTLLRSLSAAVCLKWWWHTPLQSELHSRQRVPLFLASFCFNLTLVMSPGQHFLGLMLFVGRPGNSCLFGVLRLVAYRVRAGGGQAGLLGVLGIGQYRTVCIPNRILYIILPTVQNSMFVKLYTFYNPTPVQELIYAELYTFYNPASSFGQYVNQTVYFL